MSARLATALFLVACLGALATPLTTLRYDIVGTQLKVSPAAVSVPKGVAGSVLVELVDSGGQAVQGTIVEGAHVEATFRGPSFEARRVVGPPNAALMLPPLNLVGDYQLDNIRLVDSATGETRMEGSPNSVPIRVFDEVLVSRVTSRPLTLDEIKQKGIVIDENNFRAVEFEVGFVLEGKTIPVRFPVVAPTFKQSTEIIPKEELEAKLIEAQRINQEISRSTELPPELQVGGLPHIEVQGINFQRVEESERDLELRIPPIPALLVIPGNIGYLNQFFSVQIFTENAAPQNSGLSVFNIKAHLNLPPGPDQILSTNYSAPGDDPLRFARVGPDKIIQSVQSIVRPGPDNIVGTSDDISRLHPSESGQGEFLVEGLQEGLHVMDLDLTADLDGLAAGTVAIKGKAAGSVLVRNPKFSMAFTHPRTIRAQEPYEATVTILNTSSSVANLVRVTLPATALSGAVLESAETVELGTILPGQTATAVFRLRAQRTGAISFSNLTTSEDSVQGRFRLRMGVDERGIALSPDTIAMPDYVDQLPTALVNAAVRVLGQALSVATAPQLPAGVQIVPNTIITRRVLELAEAGQRIKYGDATNRVLMDLLADWQGGRTFSEGFDQIIRSTDAGREFRDAIAAAIESADAFTATDRLADRAADFAGRGETWLLAAATGAQIDLSASVGYSGSRGAWNVSRTSGTSVRWIVTGAAELALLSLATNGTAQLWRWSISNAPPGACYTFANSALTADLDCDGNTDTPIAGTTETILELSPQILAVFQDTTVSAGRPSTSCSGDGSIKNYGTILSVLFSKPISNSNAPPEAFRFDDGNTGASIQVQPGGRVALVNMKFPFSALRPRTLAISNVADFRGNILPPHTGPIVSSLTDGASLRGRVVRVDGSPAANVPVTLTMNDTTAGQNGCIPVEVRLAQVFTDGAGNFDFDFVLAGVGYTVAAADTSGLSEETVRLILESARSGEVKRDQLMALLNSPGAQDSLLAEFSAGNVPQAIAAVEGIDRAILRDMIPRGSARIGTQVPVALRFRGRGSVFGQVLAPETQLPAPNVAVNLFPDPDSRELGRGLFTDSNGRFAFMGVPLGVFSITAQRANEAPRTAVAQLSIPGETTNVTITLNSLVQIVQRTQMAGRVFENDNLTPHPGARVFIGQLSNGSLVNLVEAVTADPQGFWSTPSNAIPIGTYDVVAISIDGKRKAIRSNIAANAGVISYVNLTLQGVATVVGRVENSAGQRVTNALVAGGEALVRSDSNGLFHLTGVPTGQRTISVGLERNPAAGNDFPRFGSASLNVLPGVENFVVVRLAAVGRIVGTVTDANGIPVPNARVAMPRPGGFTWVKADANGFYRFENMGIGSYTLSAPAPPAAENDTSRLLDQLRSGDMDQIEAAIGEAFAIFTGAADPYLNGEGQKFNPGSWGYTRAAIQFDGHTAVADIEFLPEGTISGTVLNGQGVPIGARVRLTGIGPLPDGSPGTIIRGERNTDPALGTFEFPGQAMVGDWGLQAASPFYPVVISASGRTTKLDPDATNIVLQFPPERETKGRLTGTVFYPDGAPVAAGVKVKISFGPDYVINTDSNGFFDTQIKIPAGGYSLEANDLDTDLVGLAYGSVVAGQTNVADVRLLGKGALEVLVLQANGAPASNALVTASQGNYPYDSYEGNTDANGAISFDNMFEGSYSVRARFTSTATLYGRAGVQVRFGETNSAQIRLGATATIRGRFVKADLSEPITFAQIAIGAVGFATTDETGHFELGGIPIGTYRIVGKDPVTGRNGSATATLSFDGETNEVLLVEQIIFRGEITGRVIHNSGTGVVANVAVTLQSSDFVSPMRIVTTGPDGRFSFPNTLPGHFSISAKDPETGFSASKSAILPDRVSLFEIDLPLTPVASLTGTILEPDGTPATNATVLFAGASVDTDPAGKVSFTQLRLGTYSVRATSRTPGMTRSAGRTNAFVTTPASNHTVTVRLRGVGSVSGRVLASDGTRVLAGAIVRLYLDSEFFSGFAENTFSDPAGNFSFDNIPVGKYRVSTESEALGATYNGEITQHGEADLTDLVLTPSGIVQGQVVRANGTTPVAGLDVLITFDSASTLPGRVVERTDADGFFRAENIPIGSILVEATAIAFDGLARVQTNLTSNGQVLDLGNIALDENDPIIVSVAPPNTAIGVSIFTNVYLTFTEALASNSVNTSGIYLRSPTSNVPASVQLVATNVVRISPHAPLQSQVTYQVIAIDGLRRDPSGTVSGSGPVDLVGRPLRVPFISAFTTADQDPPILVSIFPTNDAIQIDPRAVIRLSFNEPIRDSNYVVALEGVGGSASVGLNGLILTFTPDSPLDVNRTYTLTVSNVQDLAGNLALQQPFTSQFTTLDTLGPRIATLRIADNKPAVAGGAVLFEALLETNEPGATVRFSVDFGPSAIATNSPFRARGLLPQSGTAIVRAVASDRFGNAGPETELAVTVVSNQPPIVALTPLNQPLSGQSFSLTLTAADDLQVTNIYLSVSGAISLVTNLPTAGPVTLAIPIPPQTFSGTAIHLLAQSTDALGSASVPANLSLPVGDATPPSLTILSPTNNSLLDPAQPLVMTFVSSDNSSNYTAEAEFSGALTAVQFLSVTNGTNTMTQSLASAAATGAPINAILRVRDASNHVASVTHTYRLPDRRAPLLASSDPAAGALRQSLWRDSVLFRFDEPLDPLTISTNTVLFTNGIPATVTPENGNRHVRLRPLNLPLTPGTQYTAYVSQLSDLAGNPISDSVIDFTTAAFLSVTPSNGTRAIPGQAILIQLQHEPGLGADSWRIELNDLVVTNLGAQPSAFSASIRIPTNAAAAIIEIFAARTAFDSHALPPITLDLLSRDADEDGDQWPNGFEADRGMNPFVADADSADFDNDGLANGDERARGTDPGNRDTDADGLTDGREVELVCTDPKDPDSDDDGVLDSIDTDPCLRGSRPVFDPLAPHQIVQGRLTNILVAARDADSNLRGFRISGDTNWDVLRWQGSFTNTYVQSNNLSLLEATLQLRRSLVGTSEVQLVAFDADTLSTTQLVTIITVTDTNLPPMAGTVTASNSAPNTINLFFEASDPNGDPLHVIITRGPSRGRLINVTNLQATYIRDAGFIGTQEIHFRISDGYLQSPETIARFEVTNTSASPLAVLRAVADESFRRVTLTFSEPLLESTATNIANYVGIDVLGAAINPQKPRVVVLRTARLTEGLIYTLTLSGLKDTAQNDLAPNTSISFSAWITGRGFLKREVYTGIPGAVLTNLTTDPRFPDQPDIVLYPTSAETPQNFGDNYGQRLSGYLLPPSTGNYILHIAADDVAALYLSTDEDPANRVQIAVAPEWTGYRDWNRADRTNVSVPIPLDSGKRYFIEAIMKESTGGDHLGIAWQPPGANPVLNGAPPIPQPYLAAIVNPDDHKGLYREMYTRVGGGVVVADLTNHASFPANPDAAQLLPWFESPPNVLADYGQRVSGYLVPPASGDYTFYLASDNASVLYLGTDESPANKVQIAAVPEWVGYREWNSTRPGGQNISAPISLVAGARYWVEALMKGDYAGDSFGVTWRSPGASAPVNGDPPILGIHLRLPPLSLQFAQDPQSATNLENEPVRFTVRLNPPYAEAFYQWQKDGQDISGANSSNLFFFATRAGGGSRFRCLASIPGAHAASAEATLTVISNLPPQAGVAVAGTTPRAALQFDGVDDYVNFGSWNAGNQWSVEAWVKPSAVPPFGRRGILGTFAHGDWGIALANGKLAGVGNGGGIVDSGVSPITNRWYHVMATYDAATLRIYVNGELKNAAPFAPYAPSSAGVRAGGEFCCANNNFAGVIDEPRIWNIALTPEQVKDAMVGRAVPSAPLAHWSFNERFGPTTADASTNNRHGTLNGPTWTNGLDAINVLPVSGGVSNVTVTLSGADPEADPLTTEITMLPLRGSFQGTAYAPVRGVSTIELMAHRVTDPYRFSGEAITVFDITADPAADSDGDSMQDVYEVAHGLNPDINDAALDADFDGLTNVREFQLGTRPDLVDTDGDGCTDGFEVSGHPGAVAWWPGDSNATDVIGTNHGILRNGAMFGSGKLREAFNFDGVNDYVEVPSSPELKPSAALTVEAWIYLRQVGSASDGIMAKGVDADAAVDWALTVSPSGRLRPHVNVPGGWIYFDCATALFTGRWYHVAMVFDGARVQGYLDGTLDGEIQAAGRLQTSDHSLKIGAYAPNSGSSKAIFRGLIDEPSIFARALSARELRLIATQGKNVSGPNTSPLMPDTDGDGIGDCVDQTPLTRNQPPVPDALNYGIQFDGTDDFVDLGNWFTLQTFTISLWLNAGSPQVSYADIVDNNHSGAVGWVLQQNAGEQNVYHWGIADGSPNAIPVRLNPGIWQHIAITRNASGINSLYLNGTLIGAVSGSQAINYAGAQFFRLGRWGGGGRNWRGVMDEVSVWSSALSQAEIQALMSQKPQGAEPNLAGYWGFEQLSGGTSPDLSSFARHAILGGGSSNSYPQRVPAIVPLSLLSITEVRPGVFAIPLTGRDPDTGTLTAIVTSLPSHGRLYQTPDGNALGDPITVGATVTNSAFLVLYVADSGHQGSDQFRYKVNDGIEDSLEATVYTPNVSGEVFGGIPFPQGARSFADSVVSYDPGTTQPTAAHRGLGNALGPPNYDNDPSCSSPQSCTFVSLGRGGSLTLRFTDNALTGSGSTNVDLWIFEVGSDVEDTFVEVSPDGTTWFSAGKITGNQRGIDLDAFGFGLYARLFYVRLTDDPNEGNSSGATVGADIDAVGAISSAPPDCPQPPAGAVSWWPLRTSPGDVLGNNQPSATNAITFQEGATFGAGGYIEIPPHASLANQRFTISAWARADGPGPFEDNYGSTIIQAAPISGVELPAAIWRRASDGRFLFGFGNVGSEFILSANSYPTGQFHLVTATYDGSAFRFYVNGLLEGETFATRTLIYGASIPWTIGNNPAVFRNQGFSRTWNGAITDVLVLSRALSPSEVRSLFQAGRGAFCLPDITVLTFDIADFGNFDNIDQAYGDRVTNNVMGRFRYGGANPFTPNVTVSYGTIDPAFWTTGYGSLTNVLYEDQDRTGVLTVTLTADPGFRAHLHGFHLSAYRTAFSSDPPIDSVRVLDSRGVPLFVTNNIPISRLNYTALEFPGSLSDDVLTISVDARILASENDDIAIDNIRFSQSEILCALPSANLVAWWPAEDSVLDVITSQAAVLRGDAAFTSGFVARAFQFDGSGDYVEVPDSPRWAFGTNEFTIELWANFASIRYTHLVGNDEGGGNVNKWILIFDGNTLRFHLNGPALGPVDTVSVPFAPTVGRWHHLAVARTGNAYRLFIDGVQAAIGVHASACPDPAAPLTIGQAEGIGYMQGAIDELSIYHRALTADEIKAITDASIRGKCRTVSPASIAPLFITDIRMLERQPASLIGTPCPILLSWASVAGAAFTIETSTDLRNWSPVPANAMEVKPGQYQANVCVDNSGNRFFRILRQ